MYSPTTPSSVGTDRIVNTPAAYTLHGGPSIVVDLGPMNFDVVSKNGEFLGGALAAGIEISVEALPNVPRSFAKVVGAPAISHRKNTVRPWSGTVWIYWSGGRPR